MTNKDYNILCLGYYNNQRTQQYKDRALHYLIAQSFAVKLPKIDEFWPIEGEIKSKPKRLTKAKIEKIKNFHNYLMSYGWRKKENG